MYHSRSTVIQNHHFLKSILSCKILVKGHMLSLLANFFENTDRSDYILALKDFYSTKLVVIVSLAV